MHLLKIEDNKYVIVRNDYQCVVELVIPSDTDGIDTITEGTNAQISIAKWYGWLVLTPAQKRAYKEYEIIRTSTKLKQITRYCKLNKQREDCLTQVANIADLRAFRYSAMSVYDKKVKDGISAQKAQEIAINIVYEMNRQNEE